MNPVAQPEPFVVDTDVADRLRHARAASLIGLVVGGAFALFNLLVVDELALGWLEAAAVLGLVLPAHWFSLRGVRVDIAEVLLLLSAWIVFGGLVVLGGVEGTGLFWVATVPFLAYFLRPARQALWFSLAFLALVAGYLVVQSSGVRWGYPFTPTQSVQFVLSQVFYTVVAAAFQHVRSRYEAKLREQREQAQSLARAKTHFLASVSHDLRQPVQALSLFSDAMTDQDVVPAQRKLVRGVKDATMALQAMLEQFSLYTTLDDPQTMGKCQAQTTPLGPLLQRLDAQFQPLAEVRGVRLRVRSDTSAHAWVDGVCLSRVLANLLTNAISFSPGGAVMVVCRRRAGAGGWRIQVRDNGVGIDPALHERVFDEFFQVDNPQRDRTRGMGLGLSVVRRLCQRMGAELILRSVPGRGTVFELKLPAEAASAR